MAENDNRPRQAKKSKNTLKMIQQPLLKVFKEAKCLVILHINNIVFHVALLKIIFKKQAKLEKLENQQKEQELKAIRKINKSIKQSYLCKKVFLKTINIRRNGLLALIVRYGAVKNDCLIFLKMLQLLMFINVIIA